MPRNVVRTVRSVAGIAAIRRPMTGSVGIRMIAGRWSMGAPAGQLNWTMRRTRLGWAAAVRSAM